MTRSGPRPPPSLTRKIVSAVMCGSITLGTMIILEKTQAHASVPTVTRTQRV